MDDRILLESRLKEILGSPNVYFQPPDTMKLKYDCIVYSLSDIVNKHANNTVYKQDIAYELTVICRNPDNKVFLEVSSLPKCRYIRHYKSNNLNHYKFTIYW